MAAAQPGETIRDSAGNGNARRGRDVHAGGDVISFHDIKNSIAAVGDGAEVIVNNAISQAEEARQYQRFEQEQLAEAIARLGRSLQARLNEPEQPRHNPYPYLRTFDITDTACFHGRETSCDEVLSAMSWHDAHGRLAVLHGEAGFGKTSLLRAGVMTTLIANGQLPLYVQVTDRPLAEAIKKSLLPDLSPTPALKQASLQGFFRQVAPLTGQAHGVTIILDRFERFFDRPEEERQVFLHELARCLYDEDPCSRWLLCTRSSRLGYLNTFCPLIDRPLDNVVILGPLARDEARQAICQPAAAAGMEIEDPLVERLLDDLGDDAIEPAKLQIVCYTLVEALPAGEQRLTLDHYLASGPAGSILEEHLDRVLENNLLPGDRDNAWRVLEAVDDLEKQGATADKLCARLCARGMDLSDVGRLLDALEQNHLVHLTGEAYHLTSESFRPRIARWSAAQAAREKARLETIRQIEKVRDSALRGLLAGAVGFSLAFLIAFASQIEEPNLLAYITFIRAVPGGLAGLLLTLLIDVGLTSYCERRKAMVWVVGGVAGALSFALAFWFNALLRRDSSLALAALEGAMWGAVLGLGMVWVIIARERVWLQSLAVVTACSLAFYLVEQVGGAFGEPEPAFVLVFSGAVLSLSMLGAALLSHLERRAIAR